MATGEDPRRRESSPQDAFAESAVMKVLRLMAQDAPAPRLEALLFKARDCGLAPDRLAELERVVRLAIEVRTAAEYRRKREAGLTALIDAVQDMVAVTDLDALLSILTGHARRLLELDMAYVSLNLPEGGSYVHCSDGATTALSTGLRMDPGHGIGELARQKGAPVQVPDYLADDRFAHDAAINEMIFAEGLRGVIAVPMTHAGVPIGALHGASREVRHFAPEEVSLLSSLAALAAPAIETSRTVDRLRAEATAARAERERARTTLDRMIGLTDTRDKLTTALLADGDLQQMAEIAASALGGKVHVHDTAGLTLACVGKPPDLEPELVRSLAASSRPDDAVPASDGVWITRLATATDDLGVMLFEESAPLSDGGILLLRATSQAMGLALLLRGLTASGPLHDEWLDDLLEGRTPSDRLVKRAHLLGIEPDAEHVVLVLRPDRGRQTEAATWATGYAYQQSGHRAVLDESVVLLLPGSDASKAARVAAERVSRQLGQPTAVGGAGPLRDLGMLPRAHREARRCLDVLTALGGEGGSATARDLGFLGLLLSDDRDVDEFIEAALGPVLAYDAERQTDLRLTMETYFAMAGSPSRAAQSLHLHANTVARRLDRVATLLGPDWQSPAKALDIQLALRLLRARDALEGVL